MGLLDLYRVPKRPKDEQAEEAPEEKPEPLPPLSLSEFWPPSPRVRLLLIGIGFYLINIVLLVIFVIVWVTNN